MPQAHDSQGQVLTFPVFQSAGLLLAVNEIAIPVGFIALRASGLLDVKEDGRKVFRDTARMLVQSVGGIFVTERGRPWFKLN
jgi:hypothetical protein